LEEARKILEAVISKAAGTPSAQEARTLLESIRNSAR